MGREVLWKYFRINAFLVTHVSLFAHQRWLRRLRPFIHGVDACLEGYNEGKCVVYVLLSPFTKHFYVGKTICGLRERLFQHLLDVRGTSRTHVHRWLRKFGAHLYCIIPLAFTSEQDLDRTETHFIRLLQPTLNHMKVRRTAGIRRRFLPGRGSRWIRQRRVRERHHLRQQLRFHSLSYFTNKETGATSSSLATLFDAAVDTPSGRNFAVQQHAGTHFAQDWGKLRFVYGRSLIMSPQHGGLVRVERFIRFLKLGGAMTFEVVLIVAGTPDLRWARHTAIQLLADPTTIPELYTRSPDDLMRRLRQRVRIITTKRPSIMDRAVNHKSRSVLSYRVAPSPCKCQGLDLPRIDGHVACTGGRTYWGVGLPGPPQKVRTAAH